MEPVFKIVPEKKLIGKHLTMTFAENKTSELWRSFMPRRKEIAHAVSTDLFSMQVYDPSFNFARFNPNNPFEKWAAVEVTNFEVIPEGMEAFTLPGGLYAIFIHKGPASDGPRTFRHIFGTWLPDSDYLIDNRPHFEILGEKYKHEDPDSEEEVWVPVRMKHPSW